MQVNLADEWEYVPILCGKTIFQVIIPHFIPLVSSYTPWKHQKTYGFLVFGGVQKETSDMKYVKNIGAKFLIRSKITKSLAWL